MAPIHNLVASILEEQAEKNGAKVKLTLFLARRTNFSKTKGTKGKSLLEMSI